MLKVAYNSGNINVVRHPWTKLMRLIILFAPFLLLPFLVALTLSLTKKQLNKWTNFSTYTLLISYFLFISRLTYLQDNPEPSTKGWYVLYFIITLLIMLFIITPLALILQKVFYKILTKFKNGDDKQV